jgi:signal transduction histidine kinase
MALQAVADRLSDGELRELVLAQVEALDATTNRIRSLISGLPAMPIDTPDIPLSKRLVAIVDSLTPALHCLPTVVFSGPVEATVGPELSRDLEAVLREALANVARHADATEVQVRVSAQEHRLLLEVIDNGRGVGAPDRSSGLANMRRRAVRQGGELRLAIPEGGGTHLSWDVALRSQRRRTP